MKASTHSKTVSSEAIGLEAAVPVGAVEAENSHDAIARLAYGFWDARGRQGGSPAEDWFRAEREYRHLTAAK